MPRTVSKKATKKTAAKNPLRAGNNVFIRTVTHYYTGHVEAVSKTEILLSTCAWIADTGRFADALKLGKFNEVEPYPADNIVSVERGGVVDTSDWKHPLPTEQK